MELTGDLGYANK